MKKLSFAYFGSPDFAADFLEKLITDVSINQSIDTKLVVTQPDSPVGRKQILTPTPVRVTSQKFRIPAYINSEFITLNSKLKNIDLALVYAFGELIPEEFLNLPKY